MVAASLAGHPVLPGPNLGQSADCSSVVLSISLDSGRRLRGVICETIECGSAS